MISNKPSQRWSKCWPDDDTQAINSLSHASFFDGITFCNDSLRGNQQSAAANSLQKPKDDQLVNMMLHFHIRKRIR